MIAIFKREFKSYFSTPVGFIFLSVYYLFLGIFFSVLFSQGSPMIEELILVMQTIVVFTVPVITMRLMSEDRRQKVDQVLLTAPVKLSSIVFGKFFACLAVYAVGFAPTLIFEIIFAAFVSVNFFTYVYALLGMILLGAVLISVGLFISSLTESPTVSAILTFVVNIFLLLSQSLCSMITVPSSENFIGKVWAKLLELIVLILEKANIFSALQNFGNRIFSVVDIVYFLSIIAAFIFLSVRSLEKRRWS